jgi:hypothetical protein
MSSPVCRPIARRFRRFQRVPISAATLGAIGRKAASVQPSLARVGEKRQMERAYIASDRESGIR